MKQSILKIFALVVLSIAVIGCARQEKQDMQEEGKEQSSEESEEEPDPFLVLVNRIGSKDALIVNDLGEGTIHRDISKNEMSGREYPVTILEEEPASAYFSYDENERVSSIQITLQGEDIVEYRKQLDPLLGGSYNTVSREGALGDAYEWQRNNILITLWNTGNGLVIDINKDI